MKLPWDKKHLCWAITLFCTFAASVLFYMILQRWEVVWGVISLLLKSLSPVICGFVIAYLLNPLMSSVERHIVNPIFKKICRKKAKDTSGAARTISIIITWIIVCLFLYAVALLVVPEIVRSVKMLIREIPVYANHITDMFGNFMESNPEVHEFFEKTVNGAADNLTEIIKNVAGAMPNVNAILTEVSNSVYGVVVAVVNLFVGVVVSVYVLKDKEKFMSQGKKFLYSTFSVKKANKVMSVVRLTHEKLGRFLVGQIFDSILVGAICFVILTLFGIPYSALVSVVVGITNVIPFFGPFIGAIPSALLILCVDPVKCFTFVVIILILQQIDGNIIVPKIVGTTTGVSSFWVLTSILVGSGFFGVWGMICAVPIFAVIYTLAGKSCRNKLKKQGMNYSNESFARIDYIEEDTKNPVWTENN